MIANKKIALTFRIVSLLISISGILVTTIKPTGGFEISSFRFYTVQSNLLAVILFAILSFKTFKSLRRKEEGVSIFARFEMVVVIDLLLTLIVYWVLLAPTSFSMGTAKELMTYGNLTVHLITPLLCLVDYILFTKSGHLKYFDVYAVTFYPLFYVLLSTILGFSGTFYGNNPVDGLPVRFPYFFLDFDRIGGLSLIYVLGLVVFFLIISHLFYLLDKKATKKVLIK